MGGAHYFILELRTLKGALIRRNLSMFPYNQQEIMEWNQYPTFFGRLQTIDIHKKRRTDLTDTFTVVKFKHKNCVLVGHRNEVCALVGVHLSLFIWNMINPIWTGLFANLKDWPPPNLAISCQMTMKLGKDILWVEIFTKIFEDVIVILIDSCKIDFRGFWLNISKTVQLIFTKLMSFLGNHI